MKLPRKKIILAAATALALVSAPSFAAEPQPGTITVSATGTAILVPDMAVLSLSVQREGETARAALDDNNKAMQDVLAAMREAGIEDRDLQTANFNIQPRYIYPQPKQDGTQDSPSIIGYVVQNDLTVRVRKLDDLGKILDRSVTLGVNGGGNVSFTNDNPDPAVEEARKDAVARALAQARVLTQAAGVELGRILDISEQGYQPPQPKVFSRMAAAEAAPSAVPIAGGENSYDITVTVRWELKQ